MSDSKQKDTIDFARVLLKAWSWKIQLLVVSVSAFLLTYTITKFIPKEYISYAAVFPSRNSTLDEGTQVTQFGFDAESERLIQLFNSDQLRDSVIRKFDLVTRYKIDTTDPGWYDDLMREYYRNINFSKTKYLSVEVAVIDHESRIGADMANYIVDVVNKVQANILHANTRKSMDIMYEEIAELNSSLYNLGDSLSRIRTGILSSEQMKLKDAIRENELHISDMNSRLDFLRKRYDIYDYGLQVNILNKELAKARSDFYQFDGKMNILERQPGPTDTTIISMKAAREGALQRIKFFEENLGLLSSGNEEYLGLSEKIILANEKMVELQSLYVSSLVKTSPEFVMGTGLALTQNSLEQKMFELNKLKISYSKLEKNIDIPQPACFVVSMAKPSFEPIFPKSFFSATIAAIGSIFFTIFILLFRERIREISLIDNG